MNPFLSFYRDIFKVHSLALFQILLMAYSYDIPLSLLKTQAWPLLKFMVKIHGFWLVSIVKSIHFSKTYDFHQHQRLLNTNWHFQLMLSEEDSKQSQLKLKSFCVFLSSFYLIIFFLYLWNKLIQQKSVQRCQIHGMVKR